MSRAIQTNGATRFDIAPDWQAALQAAGLTTIEAVMRAEGGRATSRHARRETLPIEIEVDGRPRTLFLKRVFKVPLKHAIAPLLRGRAAQSQPILEWEMLKRLEVAGVPAMGRVAVGEQRSFWRPLAAFLLVEKVEFSHTLEDWLVPGFAKPAALSQQARRRLILEVGRLLGRLHAAGFRWPDIQAKHIFAGPAGAAGPAGSAVPVATAGPNDARDDAHSHVEETAVRGWRFRLIDVERMTHATNRASASGGTPLDDEAAKDLRRFANSLRPLTPSLRDMRTFAAGYRSEAGDRLRGGATGEGPPVYERLTKRFGLVGPRLPDDYTHPRSIHLIHMGRMIADARAEDVLRRAGLADCDSIYAYSEGNVLHKPGLGGRRERLRLDLTGEDGASRTFYLKRYLRPVWRDQLRRIFRGRAFRSTAWREAHAGKRLAMLGIPALRYAAFGEDMRGCVEARSFTLSDAVPGESLETLVERIARDPSSSPPPSERRDIIRQLALLTAGLHGHRLFHRDLYLCHVFYSCNDGGAVVLTLIDLARMLERPLLTERWRIKDLAALAYSAPRPLVTRADRLRFLYHYESALLRSKSRSARRARVDDLRSRVAARVRRMVRHDENRRQSISQRAKSPAGQSGSMAGQP